MRVTPSQAATRGSTVRAPERGMENCAGSRTYAHDERQAGFARPERGPHYELGVSPLWYECARKGRSLRLTGFPRGEASVIAGGGQPDPDNVNRAR